jgi:FAD-dependent sensor of blue light
MVIMLRRLAWSSVASQSFSLARLNEIVAPWRRNNERHHLSGRLLFTGVHFLGILEGDERDLGNLWPRLERDERHCELIHIGDHLCGKRWFPEWMMAYADPAVVSPQIERLRSAEACASKWAEMVHPIMLRADNHVGSLLTAELDVTVGHHGTYRRANETGRASND